MVGLSSLAAALVARGRARRSVRWAVGKTLETVGLAVAFLCVNVGLGFCLTLLARAAGHRFVSLYHNDDVTILALSVLQALVFQWLFEPDASSDP
ncbi:MAG TPA: hypothetical protein VGN09_18145 [Vicinamibacteria bacterium]